MNEVLLQLENPADEFDLLVGEQVLHVSHLHREMWPGVTKRDLLRYYARVGERMLPHLRDRPLGFVQYPKGLNGLRVFDRHRWPERTALFIQTVDIYSVDKGEATTHLMANDLASLLWFAQISVYELHPWYSRVSAAPGLANNFASSEAALERSALNYPDFLVIDLDPNIPEPDRAWKATVQVSLRTREILQSIGLEAFVKTSGKSGIHIFVPIERTYDYDSVRLMAKTIGEYVEAADPENVTLELRRSHRPEKVFFDFGQNVRAKTLVAAYSTRETPECTVSIPLTWEELANAKPEYFTIHTALEREADPWGDILCNPQKLVG